ncbi:MAG: CocE/NonD family hydrolase [Pseudomonadota bacterium]
MQIIEHVQVPMRDGVSLACDVWLPANATKTSTILFRTPYDRRLLNSEFLNPIDAVRAGFSVVVQDTRGRFSSEGSWKPIMWEQEGEDGYDTIDWISRQAWSNGSVGMSGPSYLGIVQLAAARLKPPALRAIAPAIATVGEFEQRETGGAMRLDHLTSWLAFMALDWAQRQAATGNPLAPEDMAMIAQAIQNPRSMMDHRPLKDISLFQIEDFPISFETLVNGDAAAQIDVAEIDIPTLHVGGWFDVFARSTVGMFQKQRKAGHREVHLLMGCWTHSTSLGQQHGEVNFGLQASAAGGQIANQHNAFFKKYLDGHHEAPPIARFFHCLSGNWSNSASWPPADAREVSCSLIARDRGDLSYLYDPANPTPTVGGRVLFIGGLAMGPIDQRKLDIRDDILTFVGAPLTEDVDLVGPVRATLQFTSSAKSTDIICKLLDIADDDTRLPITDGTVRIEATAANGIQEKRVDVQLCDTAWRIQKGHRLGLQIQSANYPHLDPNFNDGKRIGESVKGPIATNTIGMSHGQSSVTLTVMGTSPDGLGSLSYEEVPAR